MKKVKGNKNLNNEKGIATIESVLLLSIYIVFMTYCVGTFGVIHSGILNSISARAYAFETFRNRTNLVYFRDTVDSVEETTQKYGVRAHGIATEKLVGTGKTEWRTTERLLSKGREVAAVKANRPAGKMNELYDNGAELGEVNPVQIKTLYGICLSQKCGD